MKDLQEYATVIDDFQHQIEAKIRNHHTEEGFPQFNDFQTTQQELVFCWCCPSSSFLLSQTAVCPFRAL